MKRALIAIALLAAMPASTSAHKVWANGDPVPEWIQRSCCGPADAHHLTVDQVHQVPGGYKVDGLDEIIPTAKALPSQDGDYWVFYPAENQYYQGSKAGFTVFCFFAPLTG